eukprot:1159755-Pelagomonas_calceolata.AAC.1
MEAGAASIPISTCMSRPLTIDGECSLMSLDFMLTPWELKKLVGNLAEMAIVIFVTCMMCKLRNSIFSFAIVIVCAVRNNYAHIFFEASPQTRISLGASGFEDIQFLRQDSNQLYYFISDIIMDVFFCESGGGQQAEQSNHLAKGH